MTTRNAPSHKGGAKASAASTKRSRNRRTSKSNAPITPSPKSLRRSVFLNSLSKSPSVAPIDIPCNFVEKSGAADHADGSSSLEEIMTKTGCAEGLSTATRRSFGTARGLKATDFGARQVAIKQANLSNQRKEPPPYVKEQYSKFAAELSALSRDLRQFSVDYFAFKIAGEARETGEGKTLEVLAQTISSELAYMVGCIAVGGPDGALGWEELFRNSDSRAALMYGVIWLVLREHVFYHLMFGADPEELQELEDVDVRHAKDWDSSDGFQRTLERSKLVSHFVQRISGRGFPIGFEKQAEDLTLKLYILIEPVLRLDTSRNLSTAAVTEILTHLIDLVVRAARISISMRMDGNTIYRFSPVAKDCQFDPVGQEAVNLVWMMENRPDTDWKREGESDDAYDQRWNSRPLIRICCVDGCTAYRRGGWRIGDERKGFRTFALARPLVYLRWGYPKKLDEGEGYVEFREEMVKIAKTIQKKWERESVKDRVGKGKTRQSIHTRLSTARELESETKKGSENLKGCASM